MNRRSMLKSALAFAAGTTSAASTEFRAANGEAIPTWTKSTAAKVPEGMVAIRAGKFTMGSSRDNNRHEVQLSDFAIGKYLVTNAQYKLFCDAEGERYRPRARGSCYWDNPLFKWESKANHPVLWVGYNQAMAYCQWVSGNLGRTVTLPTEAQWERAARGLSGFEYPWGNETGPDDYKTRLTFNVTCAMNNGVAKTIDGGEYPHWPFSVERRGNAMFASNFKTVVYGEGAWGSDEVKAAWKKIMDAGGYTTAVGSYPPGPENCYDMAGNAFEWTRDFSTVSSYLQKTTDPCIEDAAALTEEDRNSGSDGRGQPTKIIRGGSWYANEGSCTTYRRTETRAPGQTGYHSVGFRVVIPSR